MAAISRGLERLGADLGFWHGCGVVVDLDPPAPAAVFASGVSSRWQVPNGMTHIYNPAGD